MFGRRRRRQERHEKKPAVGQQPPRESHSGDDARDEKGQPRVENVSSYKPWANHPMAETMRQPIGASIQGTLQTLRSLLSTGDLGIIELATLGGEGPKVAIAYLEALTDKKILESQVMRPLQMGTVQGQDLPRGPRDQLLRLFGERLIPVVGQNVISTFEEAVGGLTAGWSVLLLEGIPGALMLATQGWKERAVESAPTETTIHGPKAGFTENIVTNVGMVRRYVQDPSLRVEIHEVGVRSKTKVAIMYLEAIARPALVEEVRRRIKRVGTDYVMSAHQITELMEPGYHGPFNLHMLTERPDRVAYKLYFGKVAILVDGTPDVSLVPVVLVENLISMDDYYIQPALASFQRVLRFFGWLVVVFTPSLYVALMAYNPEVLKVDLAIVLAGARVGVPLNVVVEVLLLELMMELLQEATIRLPSKIGSAATVVGGLIIGQAAAQARLISNIMVVIVAMTAIASFAFPVYEHGVSWRIVKWLNVAMAAMFGLFGVFVSMTFILMYLNSLESFGTPFLAPFSPLLFKELRLEILSREPFWARTRRARSLQPRKKELDAVVTDEEERP